MTPELVAALSTGIISILAALGALVTSYRNGQKAEIDGKDKDIKLQQIHVLVNSRLTEALSQIQQLRDYIDVLAKNPQEAARMEQEIIRTGALQIKKPGERE